MRALLLPITRRSVFSPIETIVLFSIVGTLAYFQVLAAIEHSAFLASTFPSTLRTAHALHRDGEWVSIDGDWYSTLAANPGSHPVEVQQVIFSTQLPPMQATDMASLR